jgi:ABC-type uncharacterized transport system permease subunit
MAELTRRRAPGDFVFLVAVIIAAILVFHIIFVLLGTNPANDLVRTAEHWSAWLGTWFEDMFQPTNEKLEIVLNYGLATVFYLAVGAILRSAINRTRSS